ncbi:hypothetical protein BU23DRAFT_560559 [Bimuria novae-zelandiae CBS 107.79]|uniref:Uncharacterized protein n=1 Tax=Bimuria novae-zelandiae CBS 107.79 TaxID=1447943 RepID=A0A6A5UQR5_9PLEO|nr:hypothetical protein BU23DRAFT_560559 [Bimuria novae-zelandiae CBS 107.79]
MSTAPTYVYIPNLIGGQMLRIPMHEEEDTDLDIPSIPSPSDLTIDTSALRIPARDTSPAPSDDSSAVESVEENE